MTRREWKRRKAIRRREVIKQKARLAATCLSFMSMMVFGCALDSESNLPIMGVVVSMFAFALCAYALGDCDD